VAFVLICGECEQRIARENTGNRPLKSLAHEASPGYGVEDFEAAVATGKIQKPACHDRFGHSDAAGLALPQESVNAEFANRRGNAAVVGRAACGGPITGREASG